MRALWITVGLLTLQLMASEAARATVIVDPAGDALAVFGAPGPLIDIDTVTAVISGSELQVSVTFHTPIAPASVGAANSLRGGFDFDFDRNPLTGDPPLQMFFSPPFVTLDFGSDVSVDFFSELVHPGFIDVFDNLTLTLIDVIPVTFTATSASYAIPLSLLNVNGPFYFTAAFGTFDQPTDALDVRGTVPEPSTLLLLPLGIFVLILIGRRPTRQ